MNRFKFNFVVFILQLTCVIAFPQDSLVLNLNEAIKMALQNNTEIVKTNYQLKSAEFSLKEAKGNFLPKVSFSALYNRNIDKQVLFFSETNSTIKLGSDNFYSSSLDFSMPIYLSQNIKNRDVNVAQINLQKEVKSGIEQRIVTNTKLTYFNYLIALEVVKVQQSQLQNVMQILVDIKKRVEKGTLIKYDLTAAQVQVAIAKNNLLEAESNVLPAANMFKKSIGLTNVDNVKLIEPIDDLDATILLEDAEKQLLLNNSQLKQLALNVGLNNQKIQLIKSNYYPTISAVGNYNFQSQANNFKVFNYNWIHTSLVGLQFQYVLFNGTITKNKVQQAIIDKKIAEEDLKFASEDFKMQLKEMESLIEFSKKKVLVQRENLDLTKEAFQLAKKRYQLGVSTFLEVSNAELLFTQARLNWLKAILNYKSAYYNYQMLIGKEIKL